MGEVLQPFTIKTLFLLSSFHPFLVSSLLLHIILLLLRTQLFNRISQHCPWHHFCIFIEEQCKFLLILFASFTDPATNSFLHEIFRVFYKYLCNIECIEYVFLANEIGGRYNGGASFPHVFGFRHLDQERTWPVK